MSFVPLIIMDLNSRCYKMIRKSKEMLETLAYKTNNDPDYADITEKFKPHRKFENRLCNTPLSPVKSTESRTGQDSPNIIIIENRLPQMSKNSYFPHYSPRKSTYETTDTIDNEKYITETQVARLSPNKAVSPSPNSDLEYASDRDVYYDSDVDPPYTPSLPKKRKRCFKIFPSPRSKKIPKSDTSKDEDNSSLEGEVIADSSSDHSYTEDAKSASSNSLLNDEIIVASTLKKKYIRKPDYCYFCETEVLCFARHITRNHISEVEVQKILSLPPKSKERRKLLDLIRKRGNYLKNSTELFKPVRSSSNPTRNVLTCSACLEFFSAKLLYRHRKICGRQSKESPKGKIY